MRAAGSRQNGFALAAIIIFMTALMIMLATAEPVYRVQVQRELEEELIFRGQEYVRAIQKYQRQFGIFPPSIEALLDTNGMRYLRRAYVDPMTGAAFAPLTVNPDGTINGSRLFSSQSEVRGLFQGGLSSDFGFSASRQGAPPATALGAGGAGTAFGQAISPGDSGSREREGPRASPPASGFPQSTFASAQGQITPAGPASFGGGAVRPQAQPGEAGIPGPRSSQSQPGAAQDGLPTGTFGGGGIVGVRPTSDGRSLKRFNSREVYGEWEFIAIPGFGTLPFGQASPQPATLEPAAPLPFSNAGPNPFN